MMEPRRSQSATQPLGVRKTNPRLSAPPWGDGGSSQPEQTRFPGVQQMEDPISKNRLYSFSFG